MKPNVLSWQNPILLGRRNVSDKSCSEFETHILWSITLLTNPALYRNMWKNIAKSDSSQISIYYGACTLPATDTQSDYVMLHAFHGNNGYAKVPQYYVIRTWPVLLRNKIGGLGLDQCGCCEEDNEHLGSIKFREFPDQFLQTDSGIWS